MGELNEAGRIRAWPSYTYGFSYYRVFVAFAPEETQCLKKIDPRRFAVETKSAH